MSDESAGSGLVVKVPAALQVLCVLELIALTLTRLGSPCHYYQSESHYFFEGKQFQSN